MTNVAATSNAVRVPHPDAGEVPLEPVDKQLVEPRSANLADKIGAGVLAGLAGATIGLFLGAAGSMSGGWATFATRSAGVAMFGLAAVGGAAGAYLGVDNVKRFVREEDSKRVDAQWGASTLQTARNMISEWDKDGNLQIDRPTEDTRTESRYDRVQQRSTRVETTAADVWDASTARDTVTDLDLARLMSRFDADRSGTMSASERTAFDDAYGVFVVRERAH